MTPPVSRREGPGDPADRSTADETVRRNWSFVFRIISSSVRQTWEAEELTQEVFARALPHLGDRQDDERSRAYLAQSARNILRDRWRHRQYVTVETGVPDAPGPGPDPELTAVAEADRAVLVAALRRLPEEQRNVLRLRLLEGLPATEVAVRLGRNADAVRQLQHRALLRLRDEFLSAATPSAPRPGGPA